MSQRPVAEWYAAISAAIHANDLVAVAGLVGLMALDGYADEAEDLRRMILLVARTEAR